MSHRSPRRRRGGPGAPSAAPALGGPSPVPGRTRSAGGEPDFTPLACTHAPGPAPAWWGGRGSTHRPRRSAPVWLLQSLPVCLSAPQHPLSLPVCSSAPQHPQSLPGCPSAPSIFSHSQPGPVTPSLVQSLPDYPIAPVLVQRVEPGDRMLGCHGVRGGELPCVESQRWGYGGFGGREYVTRAVTHVCCVSTHMISVLCHTRALVSRVCSVCVSHVLCVSHTWFPRHVCSLVPVCPACATCVFPARATRVPATHTCVQGPSQVCTSHECAKPARGARLLPPRCRCRCDCGCRRRVPGRRRLL